VKRVLLQLAVLVAPAIALAAFRHWTAAGAFVGGVVWLAVVAVVSGGWSSE
jgi:hypothetical protein